jgi:hypothetical protein
VSTKDHSNTTALYTTRRDALISDPSADYIETTTSSLLPNKLINIKQSVLDKSSNSLEIILKALKTQNTNRIANFTVLGTCTMLTHINFIVFTKIITSTKINYINSNFVILAFTLEIKK